MATERAVAAADGIRLALSDYGGTGPAVIVLHGLGDHLVSMEPLAELLLPLHRVVSMDFRWSGQSGSSPSFSWDLLVGDVETVRTALDLGPVLIVGHSLGGIVATHCGRALEDILGVVNIDGWGFGDPELYDGMDPDQAQATIEKLRANVDPLSGFTREGDREWAEKVKLLLRRAALTKGVEQDLLEAWVTRALFDLGSGRYRIRPDPVAYDSMRQDAGVFGMLAASRQHSSSPLMSTPHRVRSSPLAEGASLSGWRICCGQGST